MKNNHNFQNRKTCKCCLKSFKKYILIKVCYHNLYNYRNCICRNFNFELKQLKVNLPNIKGLSCIKMRTVRWLLIVF